ncbi:hypothetical protein ACVWY3_002484 [Bradyrhizobium sp. USDA 4486]
MPRSISARWASAWTSDVVSGRALVRGGLDEIGEAGREQGRQSVVVEGLRRELAHPLVPDRDAAHRDLHDSQVEACGAERCGAVGQVGMAGGEAAVGNREIACTHATEPAAAAELLVDADGIARGVSDVACATLDRVGRGLQLDKAGAAELAQRELAEEVGAPFALELGGDAEQSLGPHLAPIVEAVMRFDFVSTPAIHGSPRLQRDAPKAR